MRRIRLKKRKIQSQINIVPFLDVLLVLLMIFMMVPPKFIHGFEINLPNSTSATNIINHKKHLITIEIIKTGLYNLYIDNQYTKKIHIDKLSSEIIKQKYIHSDTACLIAAEKFVKYGDFIQILDLLNNLGICSVGIITDPLPLSV